MQEETIENLKLQAIETERNLLDMRERAKKLSEIDQLTGMQNRISIERDIIKLIRENTSFSVIIMDFDGFKRVNETFGHIVSDQLLIEQAKRIITLAGTHRPVGRLGVDEFIIVNKTENSSALEIFVNEILKEIAKPLIIDGNEVLISTSIGISNYPEHDVGARRLIAKADVALYAAKEAGKNCYKVWDRTTNIEEY